MSNSDVNDKKGLPSWQLNLEAEKKGEEQETVSVKPTSEPDRATIIEQAKRFLEEDEVRHASTEKKIAFLESKGLLQDEIQQLLGVSRNVEASSTNPSPTTQESPEPASVLHTSPASPKSHAQISHTQTQNPVPPIITYPEFMSTPTTPSPLVTKTRLLTTLYLFSGLSFILYGTSTYLTTPMFESLTTARLSFLETAKANLGKLIEKLEGVVSEIPATVGEIERNRGDGDDCSESDEDPSEMFHRDIGIQTSLPTTPDGSQFDSLAVTPSSALTSQTERLSSLKKSIDGLIEDSTSEGHETSELEGTMAILKDYLDGMAYVVPNYGYGTGYGGGGYTGSYGVSNGKDVDDEISKVKASIRGVKGVLLSARSFPGGVRAGGR